MSRVTQLDPVAAQELLELKLMLEDATGRAATSHRYTRGAAVVALDASVERAAWLVAHRLNLPVSPKAKLEDIHSAIVQQLGKKWPVTVWSQIRRLHDVRNLAHHMGATPDGESMAGWISAAETYVASLVFAEYDVDIHGVVLADAIRDPNLADSLRTSQHALSRGDISASATASVEAFRSASAQWYNRHFATNFRKARKEYVQGIGWVGPERADVEVDKLHRRFSDATFASTDAEMEWYARAMEERVELLDAADAERMLRFSFDWIMGFEHASENWVPDRIGRRDLKARESRRQDGPACIEDFNVSIRDDLIEVRFSLQGIPPEEGYIDWSHALAEILPRSPGRGFYPGNDGTVVLTVQQGDPPSGDDVRTLASALKQVEEQLEDRRAEAERQAQAEQEAVLAHAEAVNARVSELPDWVRTVEWSPSGGIGDTPAIWVVSVAQGLVNPGAMQVEGEAGKFQPSSLCAELKKLDAVRWCYPHLGEDSLALPHLDIDEIFDCLKAVDPTVRRSLKETEERQRAVTELRAQIMANLTASVVGLAHQNGQNGVPVAGSSAPVHCLPEHG